MCLGCAFALVQRGNCNRFKAHIECWCRFPNIAVPTPAVNLQEEEHRLWRSRRPTQSPTPYPSVVLVQNPTQNPTATSRRPKSSSYPTPRMTMVPYFETVAPTPKPPTNLPTSYVEAVAPIEWKRYQADPTELTKTAKKNSAVLALTVNVWGDCAWQLRQNRCLGRLPADCMDCAHSFMMPTGVCYPSQTLSWCISSSNSRMERSHLVQHTGMQGQKTISLCTEKLQKNCGGVLGTACKLCIARVPISELKRILCTRRELDNFCPGEKGNRKKRLSLHWIAATIPVPGT